MYGLIKKIYYDNYTVYGAKRIYEILKLDGYKIAYKTVFDCCSRNGLVSVRQKIKSLKISKPIKEYISVRKGHSVANNIIKLIPQTINEVWVTDWTRFFVEEKTVYLYVIMDLYSRRIIGYGTDFSGENADTQITVSFPFQNCFKNGIKVDVAMNLCLCGHYPLIYKCVIII